MSLTRTCLEAEASITRARSLFNATAAAPPAGGADLTQASDTASTARSRTGDLSGGAVRAYQATTARSTGSIRGAAHSDDALAGHLTTAAAIQQAGATRLAQFSAQASQITKWAPLARSATAQKAVLTSMQSVVTRSVHTVQSAEQQASGLSTQIRGVKFKQDPAPKPPPPAPADDPDADKKDDPKKKKGVSKSFGKGGDITPTGPVTGTQGTPTDPHQVWHQEGTFDGGSGSWGLSALGSQGEAYDSTHTDGITGKSDVGVWGAKAWVKDDHTVFGNPLHTEGDVSVLDAYANASGSVTDHGVQEGVEAQANLAEIHGGAKYHLGPLDLSLGATGQIGIGGSEHFSAGEQDGKYVLGGDLGFAYGIGGKIAPHISIDKKAVDSAVGTVTKWLGDLF